MFLTFFDHSFSVYTQNIRNLTSVFFQGLNTYLTESQGVVLKKRISDSPPPYESPPDYHSLPPEVLVSARGLSVVESPSEGFIARVHGRTDQSQAQSNAPPKKGPPSRPPTRRSTKLKGLVSRPSSSASPLVSSAKPPLPSPPSSPPLCTSGGLLGLTSSCRPPAHAEGDSTNSRSSPPNSTAELNCPTPPPPPYECIVLQSETVKEPRKLW